MYALFSPKDLKAHSGTKESDVFFCFVYGLKIGI